MDMGQIMAVMQQIPTGQDGMPTVEAGAQAKQDGLFAGVLQGLTDQKTAQLETVALNVPQGLPVQERQGEVLLEALTTLMPLAGDAVKPPTVVTTESTDKATKVTVRQTVADSESQNVKVDVNGVQMGLMLSQLAGGMSEVATIPAAPHQQKAPQDFALTDANGTAWPVSKPGPAAGSEAVVRETKPLQQAAVAESESGVEEKPVAVLPGTTGVEPVRQQKSADDTVQQISSETRTAEHEHAALLQKEATVTERGKQSLRDQHTDQRGVDSIPVRYAAQVPEQRQESRTQSVIETTRYRQTEMKPAMASLHPESSVQVVANAAPATINNPLVVGTENRVLQLETPVQPIAALSAQAVQVETKTAQVPIKPVAPSVTLTGTEKSLHAEERSETAVVKQGAAQAAQLISAAPDVSAQTENAEPQAVQQKMWVSAPLMSLAATAVHATEIQPENQPVKHELRETSAKQDVEKLDTAVTKGAVSTAEMNFGSSDGAPFGQSMNESFQPNVAHQQVKMEGHASVTSVAGTGAEAVDSSRTAPTADQVVHQVRERLVNHVAKPGSDQIVLRLTPEHLGELKVNLNMDGQRLKVEIVAENATVRDSLMQNTDLLKESLSRQNIKMESFDVTTGGNSTTDSGRGQGDWRELAQRRQQNLWMPEGGYRLAKQAAPAVAAYQTKSQHTMVDVHF